MEKKTTLVIYDKKKDDGKSNPNPTVNKKESTVVIYKK